MILREKVSEILQLEVTKEEMLYLIDNWAAWTCDVDKYFPCERKYEGVDFIIKNSIMERRGIIENGF